MRSKKKNTHANKETKKYQDMGYNNFPYKQLPML